MFRSTLRTGDVDLDYVDMSYVSIDASDALEVFDRVMCANYDMSPSQENFRTINNSISACVIAGFDGYYALELYEDDIYENDHSIDGFSLRFSPKIPYFINDATTVYAIDSYKKTNSSMSLTNKEANPVLSLANPVLPAGYSESDLTQVINSQVKATVLNQLSDKRRSSIVNLDEITLYFPTEASVTGVNPLSVPGIFLITSGANYASTSSMSSKSVAGYKAIKRTRVIGFTDLNTGRHYYCYEGQLRDEEKDAASGGMIVTGGVGGKFHVDDFFDTIQECANKVIAGQPEGNNHYSPYYEIMTRKADDNS